MGVEHVLPHTRDTHMDCVYTDGFLPDVPNTSTSSTDVFFRNAKNSDHPDVPDPVSAIPTH